MEVNAESNVRTISSSMTFVDKFVFPVIWIGGFASATILMFMAPDSFKGNTDIREARPMFLMATIIGTGFLYWACMRLKVVRIKGDFLLVSNFRKEVVIPLRDVERVSGSIMMNPELIWIHLRNTTDFGTKIVFTPKWRLLSGFSPHPMVEELELLVNSAPTHAPENSSPSN